MRQSVSSRNEAWSHLSREYQSVVWNNEDIHCDATDMGTASVERELCVSVLWFVMWA